MSKKKQKFVEPEGGWNFHPSGNMCMSCTKLFDDCSGLGFADMKAVMETYEGNKVVKCTSYDHGNNEWSNQQLFKHSVVSYLGSHYS